jgi:hypothetical protein
LLTVTRLEISPEETLVRVHGIDGGAPWIFQPFESGPAHFAAEVAGGRVFAANEAGEFALLDPRARSCLRRGSLGKRCKWLRGLVRRGGKQAILYTRTGLFAIDCETLDIQLEAHGLRPKRSSDDFDLVPQEPSSAGELIRPIRIDIRPDLLEHEDGTLIGSTTVLETGKNDGPVLYGAIVFDLERRTATHLIAQAEQYNIYENSFRWFSPSGRYGVRFHYSSLPWHNGRSSWRYHDIVNRILGKGGRSGLPDCKLDGVERLGPALEVWQLKPLKPIAKPVVRMKPADDLREVDFDVDYLKQIGRAIDFSTTKPGKPFPHKRGLRLGTIVGGPWRRMHRWVECLAWEPDERAFWVMLEDHYIRRIALDGQTSQLAAVPRIRDARMKRYGGATFRVGDHALRALGDGRVRVTHGGDQIVHVPIMDIPAIGSEISVTEESFTPGVPLDLPLAPNASSALATFTKTIIEMPDLTEASVLAAIETLTGRITTALPDMIHSMRSQGAHIRTVFFTPTHVLGERTFFDFAAEQYPAAIPAIRRLIMTFSLAPRPEPRNMRLIYTENEGAFAHAALVLARFDSDPVEALTAYVTSANVGQSSFIRDDLAPTYFQRHGWRGESGVRLGVTFAVNEHFYGGMTVRYLWEKFGLRDAARQLLPEQFADILLAERKIPGREIDVRAIIVAWAELFQDETDAFDTAVKSTLLARYYSTGPETIIRIRTAVAFIEQTSSDPEWTTNAFRMLEVRNTAHGLISAREFADLIAMGAHARVGETFEDRMAARIIQIIRGIAEALDPSHDYDAEVMQILRKALDDVVARVRPASNAKWFAYLLLGHFRSVQRKSDPQSKREYVVARIEDLCLKLDPGHPFDAEIIAALREAAQEKEPWNWHEKRPTANPASST